MTDDKMIVKPLPSHAKECASRLARTLDEQAARSFEKGSPDMAEYYLAQADKIREPHNLPRTELGQKIAEVIAAFRAYDEEDEE